MILFDIPDILAAVRSLFDHLVEPVLDLRHAAYLSFGSVAFDFVVIWSMLLLTTVVVVANFRVGLSVN